MMCKNKWQMQQDVIQATHTTPKIKGKLLLVYCTATVGQGRPTEWADGGIMVGWNAVHGGAGYA